MKNLTDTPRLALALEQWRGLRPDDPDETDILSALVSRLCELQPEILAYAFFGCREDGAARFSFMGTEAADTLKVDGRHGARAIGPHLGALDDIIAGTDRRSAARIRAHVNQLEFAILLLPTGPDASGAPGFLGIYEKVSSSAPDQHVTLEYLDAPADFACEENGNITPIRAAG